MEKQQAYEKSYSFTGIYEHSKEAVKQRQQEYKGYKTVIVNVRASGYERDGSKKGSIQGYSLYAETKYFEDKRIAEVKIKLSRADNHRAFLKAEYEDKLAKFNEEMIELEKEIN